MANAFDQFDAPAVPAAQPNAFDQFDAPETSGGFLPLSGDATKGTLRFDPNAGILGSILRALKGPGDAYAGRLDPMSSEGQQSARDLASVISPVSPALRAGLYAAPTIGALKDATDAGYSAARATGATYGGDTVAAAANSTIAALNAEGFIAKNAPKTHAILEELTNPPSGGFATISGLDAARQRLGEITGDKTDMAAARRSIAAIDGVIEKGGAPNSVAGAPAASGTGIANWTGTGGAGPLAPTPEAQAAELIRNARGNAAAAFRSDRVTGAEDAAELRAAAANSGHNVGNALRQRLSALLQNKDQTRGFSDEELTAIRQVVQGTATSNTLRHVANMLGGGGGLGHTLIGGLGAALGAYLGGGEGGAALGAVGAPALGSTLRAGYNSLVGRQINALDELIRQRSPLYQQTLRTGTPYGVTSPRVPAAIARGGLLSLAPSEDSPSGLLGP